VKTNVNDLPNSNDGRVKNVWCIGREIDPDAVYVADQPTMGEQAGMVEMPIRSIGRNRRDGLLYASTDFRFVSYPGHILEWPNLDGQDGLVEIRELVDEPGRFASFVKWNDVDLWNSSGQATGEHAFELAVQFCNRAGLAVRKIDSEKEGEK